MASQIQRDCWGHEVKTLSETMTEPREGYTMGPVIQETQSKQFKKDFHSEGRCKTKVSQVEQQPQRCSETAVGHRRPEFIQKEASQRMWQISIWPETFLASTSAIIWMKFKLQHELQVLCTTMIHAHVDAQGHVVNSWWHSNYNHRVTTPNWNSNRLNCTTHWCQKRLWPDSYLPCPMTGSVFLAEVLPMTTDCLLAASFWRNVHLELFPLCLLNDCTHTVPQWTILWPLSLFRWHLEFLWTP